MTDPPMHGVVTFEPTASGRFAAVCSCGWRSDPQPTAARAGALSDEHRRGLDDHQQPT